ncbi:MAG: dipeptidase [Cytophagales bacterium]|nr:dipeptidase [Cytophagales bacterium]
MVKESRTLLGRFMRALRDLLGVLILLGLVVFFFVVGKWVDRQNNVRLRDINEPIIVSERAKRLHATIAVADWHSDNLLWDRDPLTKHDHGHVDIPRLIEGNFAIQVFDAVIKVPQGLNYESNTERTDQIKLLSMANRWPVSSWFGLIERALHQSQVLHDAANESSDLVIIKTRGDLEYFMKQWNTNGGQIGGMLSIEGLHAMEGKLENLQVLIDAGYRMFGLVHFFDNEIGGSSAGVEQGGLTDLGRQVVRIMNEESIIIDLAHASEQLIDEVLAMTTKPVVVSHTGVKGVHDSPRNLSDRQLRAIAENGGMVGLGFWEEASGGESVNDIARAIRYTADLIGVEHVSLGSDFDGAVTVPFDASQIILLTEALMTVGFSDEEITQIMGGNQIRFLMENLPGN